MYNGHFPHIIRRVAYLRRFAKSLPGAQIANVMPQILAILDIPTRSRDYAREWEMSSRYKQ